MRPVSSLALFLLLFSQAAVPQTSREARPPAGRTPAPAGAEDPVAVFTEHPRLFLRPPRLRLLQRERERMSVRWQQLDGFVSADAPMPEGAFAQALYYQVTRNAAAGQRAVAWALGPGADLRQLALVFDWCQDLLSETQRRDLAARIQKRMTETAADESIPAVRSRLLAAVALFDHVPQSPKLELERIVRNWWGEKVAPALSSGRNPVRRDDAFPLWELLHALRDSTNIDLRESDPRFFKQFPVEHLMSHYPAPFPGDDNDYRIGASVPGGEPDLTQATYSRAAELAMVAYDSNGEESQYLQGWLMRDHFMLRSPLGAPYEFLWANPYQPGLSFTILPLLYHDSATGRLFLRSDWDDTAEWFGYFDGVAQLFRNGRVSALDLKTAPAPVKFDSALVYFGAGAMNFHVTLEEDQEGLILIGLAPRHTYQVEIDDEEVSEETTDPGGILVLDLLRDKEIGVRLRELK
ncbi:MAG: hypothetical protein C5B51_03430 [Terriglobia bacterium]|nr:MAG: hypothetical protein C5B51_03430 [Terriglobia bacterium]